MNEEEKIQLLNRIKNGICISIDAEDVITYAIQQNGSEIINDVVIENTMGEDIDNLVVKVDSDTPLIDLFEVGVQKIRAGEELHLRGLKIKINGDYLSSLTERISCILRFYVYFENEVVASDKKEIVALAFDQWPGLKYTPEILAAFSMPNHPAVTSLIQLASQYLEKWTGDPSLAGYQYDDPNRVKQMAAAAYAAIQQKNITYVNPPSSFEEFGQRIRLADAVLEKHLGTCMDMTLLYVACLEAMGLNPVMVFMRGHIFAGLWLVEDSFSETIMDDPSHLEKRMANGIYEILVVECTAMCAGKFHDFDKAVNIAEGHVADYHNFEFVIDVARARSLGIRPLPVRVMTEAGFIVKHEERKEKDITDAPAEVGKRFDLNHLADKTQVTKLWQWERKLLDLSLRNMLINLRFTKAVVPLFCSNISILEDALTDGEEFQVLPRPDNMLIKGEGIPIEALTDLGSFQEFMELESKHKRLHSFYPAKELNSSLTKMYRSAKTSLEENGASTLYLVLGLLRWTEGRSVQTVRYAPIILLPIDITRKSASQGYTMHMRDEDAQMNITLLEFLKQNYNIRITGLNPLPTDEHGLDIPKILAIIRHGIMNLGMWDVIEVGLIGNFSFSQFVMWNDIHSRSDMLERNSIVRSLMKGAVDWDCTIPDQVNTDEAYLPVTADASQLRAINMATNDVSFVLHGPPGTGKSQTITAMIANALTKGKTVLFVAEKMAALEVVQKRIEALGIGVFCLELHSNKATKKAVLDQLKKTLEIGVWGIETDYDQKIGEIKAMRAELDAYVQKLHMRRRFGKSLRELIDLYEMIPDYGVDLNFPSAYACTVTQSDLDGQKRSLEQLIVAGKEVGHPHGHPLSAIRQTIYTQTLKMNLEEVVSSYKSALEELKSVGNVFAKQLGINEPIAEKEWKNVCVYAESVISAESIPMIFLHAENLDQEFELPLSYASEKDSVHARRTALLRNWQETFLYMDMGLYHRKYEEANKKMFGKAKALSNLAMEIQAFAFFHVYTEQIPAMLADVELFQKQEAQLEAKKNQLSFEWKQILVKCPTVGALQTYKQDIKSQLAVIEQFTGVIRNLVQEGKRTESVGTARKVLEAYEIVQEKQNLVSVLLNLSFEETDKNWIESREKLCDRLIENESVIKDWIVYRQIDEVCRKAGLGIVCDAYEGGLPHEQVMSVYLKSIYKSIILSVIEEEPVLNNFTGNGFHERIVQFQKLDTEFMELTKKEMYYRLTHGLPTGYESVQISKELNILRRAIGSNGRGVSIRSLFDQIPNVLKKLTPCMLMSPISVAQYLSADGAPYDIVIFDEASQLPTCKAVGALARGKNAVIVGDPNQMPPTSFFAGNTIDEDNLDIEDLDSILDDCLALGMPSAHLQWHYRSHHESLIAFSNHEFYENAMLTFPSVNDREKHVSMVKVDSFFDRKKGRINEGEAKAIVEEIKRRYRDAELRNQTLGVVTFNISQQTLIEDLLQEEFARDIQFEQWATTGEELLFVKNLENAQGDERDVILFSVAYGPDEEGNLSLNFGPLNKQGGWKRLNVAVTRARCEMMVFSTITADMINLKRTKSKGVESLKDFLEFAEKGKLPQLYTEMLAKKDWGILGSICSALAEAGYQYQTAVGHSKFKVDLAVINPYNKDEYLLGIMLDGDSYRLSSNTKDREVAQMDVLESLGWSLHRIWTIDWWDNKQKEIDKLLSLLEEKKNVAFETEKETRIVNKEVESVKKEEKRLIADILEDSFEHQEEFQEITTGVKAETDKPGDSIQMFLENHIADMENLQIAHIREEKRSVLNKEKKQVYCMEWYISAELEVTPLTTSDYVLKSSVAQIADRIQQIINLEAPIREERLIKKTLRSFAISRASAATTEATEKAIKKATAKSNKQNGVKFYWKENQSPDHYTVYRIDTEIADKRTIDDVCQQELKNAVCFVLQEKGSLSKEDLVKETIRTMGYARSGVALVEAVERGMKYGRKTGEIIQNEDKLFTLSNI